jgi:hypothetical protein
MIELSSVSDNYSYERSSLVSSLMRNIAVCTFAALSLFGCGSDSTNTSVGGGATTTYSGKFVDATVVGIPYKCGSSTAVSGTTDATGQFTCPSGQGVAFYVGDILLGSAGPGLTVVTPLDLVGVGSSPSNTTVSNIVRFLMSISSTDPSTGTITVPAAVVTAAAGKSADFTAASTAALNTLITTLKAGATVYTNAQAATHLSGSLNGIFSGSYGGTFAGTIGGTWSITISSSGVVAGTAKDSVGGVVAVTGSVSTTLSTGSNYAFTGTAGGTPWVGNLNIITKVFSGTWDAGPDGKGTFTGKLN